VPRFVAGNQAVSEEIKQVQSSSVISKEATDVPGPEDERHSDEIAAAATASDGDDDGDDYDGALDRDATRQTGDISLYKICLSSVGWHCLGIHSIRACDGGPQQVAS
jgi:hypothetical protein